MILIRAAVVSDAEEIATVHASPVLTGSEASKKLLEQARPLLSGGSVGGRECELVR